MTKREAVAFLIKLMMVYAMLQIVPSLVHVIGVLDSIRITGEPGHAALVFAITLIAPLIWIGLCLLVIRFSNGIAMRIVRDDGECGKLFSLTFKDCQILGYNFIGLILIVQSLPMLIELISAIRFEGYIDKIMQRTELYRTVLPEALAFAVQFGIGLTLFLRAQGLANLWERFQQKARPMRKKPDNQAFEPTA